MMTTFQQICLDLKKYNTPNEQIPYMSGEADVILTNGTDKVKLKFNRLGSLIGCLINNREVTPFPKGN